MIWGLKTSFLRYLAGMADARSTAASGAGLTPSGQFFFEFISREEAQEHSGILRFRGDIRFSAHHGMLFVMIADPWIEYANDHAVLTIIDATHLPDTTHRIPLVELEWQHPAIQGRTAAWKDVVTHLTPEGAHLFNDIYKIGEEFDPLQIRTPHLP